MTSTRIGGAVGDAFEAMRGAVTFRAACVIERGPVTRFARAVKDDSSEYAIPTKNVDGAFEIPVPPTFPVAMRYWGEYPEQQPDDGPDSDVGLDLIRGLTAQGGLMLHGEQEFEYLLPLRVGQELLGEGRLIDVQQKESGGRVMTMALTEDTWRDRASGEPVLVCRRTLIHRS